MKKSVKILELFSGIGGMHYALEEARKGIPELEFDVKLAIDISDVANQVYKHNFPNVECKSGNICGLTPEKLSRLGIEGILMSPPCQPFTRQGNKKDIDDNRSLPLIHILEHLIPKVTSLRYILLENVKGNSLNENLVCAYKLHPVAGFECSQAHKLLLQTLSTNEFHYQEYLICPKQLGIPNSRLRYYLIASKSADLPQFKKLIVDKAEIDPDALKMFQKDNKGLVEYIDDPADPFDKTVLELGDKLLEKHAEVLDIVDRGSLGSCCFTKSYGKFAEGTGK